jgi:hypothetical protein
MIPYSETLGIWRKDCNTIKRAEVAKEFMDIEYLERHHLLHPSLDIGEKNYIGTYLGIEDNTEPGDFNFEICSPRFKYKTITCFEVLEHVMNPLSFMQRLYTLLELDGRLYLSTPVIPFISWYQWNEHFTEYKEANLEILFEYAGFKIVRKRVFRPFKWWFYFTGFRPFARLMMKSVIYELRKR